MKIFYIYNIAVKIKSSGRDLDKKTMFIITSIALVVYMVFSLKAQTNFWLGRQCHVVDYFHILVTFYLAVNIFIVNIIDNTEEIVSSKNTLAPVEIKKKEARKIVDDFLFSNKIHYDFKSERIDKRLNNNIPVEAFSPPEPDDVNEDITNFKLPEDISMEPINFDFMKEDNLMNEENKETENKEEAGMSAEDLLRKNLSDLL